MPWYRKEESFFAVYAEELADGTQDLKSLDPSTMSIDIFDLEIPLLSSFKFLP